MSDDNGLHRLVGETIQEHIHDRPDWMVDDLTDAIVEALTLGEIQPEPGRADWLYNAELDMHIPCCSQPKGRWRCGNGPLVGDTILTGNCNGNHE